MKYTKKDVQRVIRTLLVTSAGCFLLAVMFAVLWVIKPSAAPLPEEKETNPAVVSEPEPPDTEELARLKDEENALKEALSSAEEEIKRLREEAEKAAEEKREPTDVPVKPIEGSFDVGDLIPPDPASLETTYDLKTQYALIADLEAKIGNCPYIVDPGGKLIRISDIRFDEDTEILYKEVPGTGYDRDGNPLLRKIDYEGMGYTRPKISVAYRDFERGITYEYGGDTVYFSASLIKVPYVYTLLDQFAQYNAVKKANPTNDPKLGETLSEEILEKYDLERKITLTESMKAEGSGPIRDMDLSGNGKEFTVLELISYAVKDSDNTAFKVLRTEFGYDYFWAVSRKLGCDSVFTSFNNLTADHAVRYLSALYDFAKDSPDEAGILVDLMRNASHRVMIPTALNKKTVSHKYGWDEHSYHDMAIVWDEAPYAVCVMTDFDFPTNDDKLNEYIRSLIKTVDALHESFSEK